MSEQLGYTPEEAGKKKKRKTLWANFKETIKNVEAPSTDIGASTKPELEDFDDVDVTSAEERTATEEISEPATGRHEDMLNDVNELIQHLPGDERKSWTGSLAYLRKIDAGEAAGKPEQLDNIIDMLDDYEDQFAGAKNEEKKKEKTRIKDLKEQFIRWQGSLENLSEKPPRTKESDLETTIEMPHGEDESKTPISTEEIEKTAEREESSELVQARNEYLVDLKARRRWLFGRAYKQELDESRGNYEAAVVKFAAKEITGETIEDRNNQIAMILSREHAVRSAAELEMYSEGRFGKAKAWLARHRKARFVIGMALTAGAYASVGTGNIPAAGLFIGMRAALAGVGTAVTAESGMNWLEDKFGRKFGLRRGLSDKKIEGLGDEQLMKRLGEHMSFSLSRGRGLSEADSEQVNDLYSERLKRESGGDTLEHLQSVLTDYNKSIEAGQSKHRVRQIGRAAVSVAAGAVSGAALAHFAEARLGSLRGVGPKTELFTAPEVAPVPKIPESFDFIAGEGKGFWHYAENSVDRVAPDLTPDQRTIATDWLKDRWVSANPARATRFWLNAGERLSIDTSLIKQAQEYALTHTIGG